LTNLQVYLEHCRPNFIRR